MEGFTFEMILLCRASWHEDVIPNCCRELRVVFPEPYGVSGTTEVGCLALLPRAGIHR